MHVVTCVRVHLHACVCLHVYRHTCLQTCMCLCALICLQTHTCLCALIHMLVCALHVYRHLHTCLQTCMSLRVLTQVLTDTRLCALTHVPLYTFRYLHTCLYAPTHIYPCTYGSTHAYTHVETDIPQEGYTCVYSRGSQEASQGRLLFPRGTWIPPYTSQGFPGAHMCTRTLWQAHTSTPTHTQQGTSSTYATPRHTCEHTCMC